MLKLSYHLTKITKKNLVLSIKESDDMTNLNIMELFNNIDLFLKIFNNVSDMVYPTKVEGKGHYSYILANESGRKFVGLTEDSFGKRLEEILPRDTAELIIHKYDVCIRRKGTIAYEERMKIPSTINTENQTYPSKQYIYWDSKITPIFDNEGNCTHIIAIVRDITERKKKEKEFKKIKDRLELIWDTAADAVYTIDTNANFLKVNKAFTNLLGWTEDELLSNQSISIIPDHFIDDINEVLERLKSGEVIPSHQVQRKAKDGSIIDVLASYSPIIDDEGQFNGAVVIYKDITDQNKYYRQLQESEERYRLIADHSLDLIKVVNLEGIIKYASPSHLTKLGIPPEYYLNKSILSFLHSEDMYKVKDSLEKIIDSKQSVSLELRRLKKSGDWIWFDAVGTPVFDDNGHVIRIIFEARDITERKEYEQKLEHLALYDNLTSLPNRVLFNRRLKEEMEQTKRLKGSLAIMFLDLDRFKQVNDTMGHDIGDELLNKFGERVKGCLREKDTIARLGGDEFVILLPNLGDDQEPINLAKEIIKALQEPWEIGEHNFNTTSSIGIALYQHYEINHSALLKNADIALYEAKEKGRNNYQVYQD